MMKLDLYQVKDILFHGAEISVEESMPKVEASYDFLRKFAKDKLIYGINTGFGPMAQWRVDDKSLIDLQYNIIRSHSTGMGKALSDLDVRAAMIARLGSLIQGKSGVYPYVVDLLTTFIRQNIIPYVPEHGSVGASGDLVQLAHIALCLIGEGKVHYKGEWRQTKDVMRELGINPMTIHIREGLSVTNGTSVMTGISMVNQCYAENLLEWSILSAVWMNEIASSFDDWMSAPLNEYRRHQGQIEVAKKMREIAAGSRCLQQREHELYDPAKNRAQYFEHKVQAYYSLRCTPQILGPISETLQNAKEVLELELNAASDNPIVDPDTNNVYHGGNFHGDYISLEEDKVKIAMVRLAMTAERQLNYLLHDRINGILPPFLNMGTLGLNYAMQACQFTATSTTAECQTLAMPNYVHSIPNNNDNQDIVSMGTNTAELCRRVIKNAYQVMSVLMMALAQATDCLSIQDKLAPATGEVYRQLRKLCNTIQDDRPFYEDLEKIEKYLKSTI
ncbi:MAG: aromatic amino acid lyase [Bacteroidales bacterium]|nr:aromatic amino acid lyase [Bacteroidales bacterium]